MEVSFFNSSSIYLCNKAAVKIAVPEGVVPEDGNMAV